MAYFQAQKNQKRVLTQNFLNDNILRATKNCLKLHFINDKKSNHLEQSVRTNH